MCWTLCNEYVEREKERVLLWIMLLQSKPTKYLSHPLHSADSHCWQPVSIGWLIPTFETVAFHPDYACRRLRERYIPIFWGLVWWPRLILVVMYFAVFLPPGWGAIGCEAVPGRYPIPSASSSFHSWACGSATKRGLGCKTGGYSAKLAHLPGYGVTPILGHSPPHNNIIPPPTPAVYQALSNLLDMILNLC